MLPFIKNLFNKDFFTNKKFISIIWLIVSVFSIYKQYSIGRFNNYKIYKGVYFHLINKQSLYLEYPLEYFDFNHYGPIFSFIIAPFAILPDAIGIVLWGLFNTMVLLWAINLLPLKQNQINAILWICFHEFLTTVLCLQFNPLMTAIILLSFVFIDKEKVFWAALFITLGTFIKLYGIVGLAFFFFTKNKIKFIASLLFWSILLFCLPMLLSSPYYILNTYGEWFERLALKNATNAGLNSYQDICIMGMIRRIFQDESISNLPFILSGLILFGIQYLRIKQFKEKAYRMLLLSSVLIFTVIFSTGSESPTYIIAFTGVAIWFVIQPKPITNFYLFLFIFAIVLTSLSPSDLMPKILRENYIRPYALKALPCIFIWIAIIYEIYSSDFKRYNTLAN